MSCTGLSGTGPCTRTEARSPSYNTNSLILAAEVYIYDDVRELDEVPAAGTEPNDPGIPAWKKLLWEGGHPADAFLTAASAQVGLLSCQERNVPTGGPGVA